MVRKLIKKIIGGVLVALMVFVNFANVYAATLIVEMSSAETSENSLAISNSETLVDAKDLSEGYVRMKVLSAANNVIKVELTASTEVTGEKTSLPLTDVIGTVYFNEGIWSNFDITTEGEGIEYRSEDHTINWVVGDMAINTTKSAIYNLTLKETYSDAIVSDKFLVALEFDLKHTDGAHTTKFEVLEGNEFCIPFVRLVTNTVTGLFTDVIILSAIVVAAAGILVITLKSNKFVKI